MYTPCPKCPLRYPISCNGVDSDDFCHTQFILNAKGNVLLNRSQISDKAYDVLFKKSFPSACPIPKLFNMLPWSPLRYLMNSNGVDSNWGLNKNPAKHCTQMVIHFSLTQAPKSVGWMMCFLLMTFVPVQKLCANVHIYIYIYIYMLFYMSSVFFGLPVVSCSLMIIV